MRLLQYRYQLLYTSRLPKIGIRLKVWTFKASYVNLYFYWCHKKMLVPFNILGSSGYTFLIHERGPDGLLFSSFRHSLLICSILYTGALAILASQKRHKWRFTLQLPANHTGRHLSEQPSEVIHVVSSRLITLPFIQTHRVYGNIPKSLWIILLTYWII